MAKVSICIPTYNRLDDLRRSVASALSQSYSDLEVVVADNASQDGTASWLEKLSESDPRLRLVVAQANAGPTANFVRAQQAASGDYVMWLGDDDWLDEGYVERCVELLDGDPCCVHAAGQVRYHAADGREWDGITHPLNQADPADRVLAYYRTVRDNGVFYGLTRATAIEGLAPMREVMGNDWFHVAALSLRGTVEVDVGVRIHRSIGGATLSLANVARVGRYPTWHAVMPQVAIVFGAVSHLLADTAAPGGPNVPRRRWLAARVGFLLSRRLLPQAAKRLLERSRARFAIHRSRRSSGNAGRS